MNNEVSDQTTRKYTNNHPLPATQNDQETDVAVDDLLNALMGQKPATPQSAAAPSVNHHPNVRKRTSGKLLVKMPRKRLTAQAKKAMESAQQPTTSAPCRLSTKCSKQADLCGQQAQKLQAAGCKRVSLEEAMVAVEKFLDDGILPVGGINFEQAESVFGALCIRQLIVEKIRAELISRVLCPVTLHTLSRLFAMSYCSTVMLTK